jgi:hypothetical protein
MKKHIALPTPDDTTEALLQSLIAECHAVIRDVVLPSALGTDDGNERRRYLGCVSDLAGIGASVGDTIARLRGGGGVEARQRITVERVQSLALPAPLSTQKGEGG